MHVAALALIAIAAQDQSLVDFKQTQTHFIFSYPKTWKQSKTRYSTIFEFPVNDKGDKGTVEVMSLANSNDKDEWQIGQANAVKAERRELVRQWQEEILEVPLMMTRSKLMRGEQELTRDTGMLYSDSAIKFVFHLVAPTPDFDSANYMWHQVLQTLRHEAGTKQKPFDPNGKPKLGDGGKMMVWGAPAKEPPKKPVIGEMSVAATAAGKNFALRYPKGWTVTKADDKFEFKHPDVAGPVTVAIQSQVDSAPVARALLSVSSDSLERYATVTSRLEAPIDYTRAGMTSTFIWRIGTTASGPLTTLEGAGSLGNEYWLLTYSAATAKPGRSIDRIRDLMQILRIEAAN